MNKRLSTHCVCLGILMIILLAGCTFPSSQSPSATPPPAQDILLVPAVEGCAETEQGQASKSGGGEEEQDAAIQVNGSTISYTRALRHQCCRKVELEKLITGSTITLYETWSGQGCKCMCFSTVNASLEKVPAGNYTVVVIERGTQAGSSEPMEEKTLAKVDVTVP
jgi:hypothetical protein